VGWPVIVAIVLGVVAALVLWRSYRNELERAKAELKSEEHVNDAMQAEVARAGTVIDAMAPPEVAAALDKLGGPGTQ